MKLKLAYWALVAETAVLLCLFFYDWKSFDLRFFHENLNSLSMLTIAALLLLLSILLKLGYPGHMFFRKKTSALMETRRILRRQQDALHKITSSKAIYSGDVNRAVLEIGEITAQTLGIEAISTWLFNNDFSGLYCLDRYNQSTGTHYSGSEITRKDNPLFFEILQANRVIAIDDITSGEFPEAEVLRLLDREALSIMVAPIRLNAELRGVVCFSRDENAAPWTTDQQSVAGSIADFLSIALEAGERKKIEYELLRRSIAIESAVDGMAILDSDEHFVFINQALADIFGYSSVDELTGKNWKILYSPAEVARFETEVTPVFRADGKVKFEAVGIRKNLSVFPHEVSLTSLEGGGFVCSVTDITERKKAEQSYLESQIFLHKVINANPNFIFVKDINGRFTLVNQATADVYGTTVEDIIGKTDADFNPNAGEVEHFQNNDRDVILGNQEIFIAEEKITDAKGNIRWLQTTKRPLAIGPDREIQVLGVATDITDRKKLQNQLVQAQKMEAIGQLAGGVAHDFNNYLTGILGYTALIKMSGALNKDIEHAADMIENTAHKAAMLTEKLLGFARKGKNQNIPVDLHNTIKETFSLLSRTIEKTITINFDLEAVHPFVLGDPTQMQQVVLNLAINARDSMNSTSAPAKRILISSKNIDVNEDPRSVPVSIKKDRYVVISVSDTGCGIDAGNLDKIFEPFFTTKEPDKGTGMGLAMVYGIVKNHAGYIFVESEPGKGSTFTIYLPCSERKAPLMVEKIPVRTITGKGHILIVDDHQVIRDVTSRMLTSLGYDVVTAKDGIEAVQYFEENKYEIDLVILDMVMPNMGARECYRAIKKINPAVRAILSTGYDRNNAVQEILNEGIAGFVQKPYQLNKLSEVIAQVLQH